MPVTFSSYRLGPGQRVSNKTVPPPWDWLLRRENELGPRRSKSRITFAVLVPPFYVAVQAPALIVTVIAYNIVLAHIPGRANAAADFLSRMQTDPTQSLELQLLDSIPLKKHIELDMKAKTPDSSMLMIKAQEQTTHYNTTNQVLSQELIQTLQSNAQLQQLIPNLNDLLDSASHNSKFELCEIKRAPELNSIQQNDPLNYFEVIDSPSKPVDIQKEQRKDPVIRKVINWVENGCTDDLTYASFELRKYHKHLDRLQLKNGILCRNFFDDVGKISNLQVCIPKQLRDEVI